MAEDPFWRHVRLQYESWDTRTPEGQRTVAKAHLATGEAIEITFVVPIDGEWTAIQTREESAHLVRSALIVRVEIGYERGERGIGFRVGSPDEWPPATGAQTGRERGPGDAQPELKT